jgi:hypothetical protein
VTAQVWAAWSHVVDWMLRPLTGPLGRALTRQEHRQRWELLAGPTVDTLHLEALAEDLADALEVGIDEAMDAITHRLALGWQPDDRDEPSHRGLSRAHASRAAYALFAAPVLGAAELMVRGIERLDRRRTER